MATISIYPPVLNSTQPAFIYNTSMYEIYFRLHQISSLNEVGHIQIRIVKLSNNKSIANIRQYPDGTIYKNKAGINTSDYSQYAIPILDSDLSETWQPGCLYKIQMRFGANPMYTNLANFASWKQEQINTNAFSEWSTVMVIKAIDLPEVYIKNKDSKRQDVIASQKVELTLTPEFFGSYVINARSKEAEDLYKFNLYKGDSISPVDLIETSGWLQHNAMDEPEDVHRFKTRLINYEGYTVTYQIKTVNGYEETALPYYFLVEESYLRRVRNVDFWTESDTTFCEENGCVEVHLQAEGLSGNFVLVRASETDNFATWEDLKFFLFFNKTLKDDTLIFRDYTIESGFKYKYAFQQENSLGIRTTPLEDSNNKKQGIREVNFEYSYLYHDKVQLRLQFNQTVNTFKHTALTSKQDTLGSRFPRLTKNGQAYYAEFPIGGLISLHMDNEGHTFFHYDYTGYYYNDELIIPPEKYEVNEESVFDFNLVHNNIYVERIFREKVEEFLNNFDYKLYKSPTEGNIAIVLQNVTLTPKQELGRMIYEFSGTAYEVAENNLQSLDKYGIINIGEYEVFSSDDVSISFGQISGLYTGRYTRAIVNGQDGYITNSSPTELVDEIKKDVEEFYAGGYKLAFRKIKSLWIEQYPDLTFQAELTELEALHADAVNKGEDTSEIDNRIAIYKNLSEVLLKTPDFNTITLEINGKEIVMMRGRVYNIDDIYEDITSLRLKYTYPLIINYTCEMVQAEDESLGVISSVDTSKIWGQIQGIFTDSHKILKNYDYHYKYSSTYRIFNTYQDKSIIKDKTGKIIVDNTNINLYKTKNLYNVVKEEAKRQVESMYGVKEFLYYNEEEDEWNDGTIWYVFSDLMVLDIEADANTIMYIGKKEDGSDKVEVAIGPTQRYVVKPAENLIRYIAFKDPQFAIINYVCLTNQIKRVKRG